MNTATPTSCTSLSRRGFVAGATAAVVAGGLLSETSGSVRTAHAQESAQDPYADCETVYGCCSPECQHHSLKGYLRDGKLVKVEAGEVNECGICPRGVSRVELCNSDLRLTKPLRLNGAKGSGEFVEITWDEAFDLIEEKMREAIETDGTESISYFTGSGNFSALVRTLWAPFFSWMGGVTATVNNTCCGGVDSGMTPMLGKRFQAMRDDIEYADYIIAWGNNPAITMGGYFERFENMIANGGKLVTIDPYYTESADKSAHWLQPYPGHDVAVAYGMLNVIINEKLYKEDFLIEHTTAPCLVDTAANALALQDTNDPISYLVLDQKTGTLVRHDAEGIEPALSVADTEFASTYTTVFDLIAEEAAKWEGDALTQETGVPADTIAEVAREYATADRAMIIQNMGGFQRTEFGSWAVATQIYLALFCGQIGHRGDGICDAGGVSNRYKVGDAFTTNADAKKCGSIPKCHFGEYLLEEKPNKINVMWVATANPVAQMPNTNMIKKGFEQIPFVVTLDMYMTATALWSDLVLPVTAVFETPNVTASSRSQIVSLSEGKATRPGEAKTDLEIAAEIATRFGFGDKFNEAPEVYIERVIEPLGITYEQLEREKAINTIDPDWIAYKDGVFSTDSKKAEMWVASWLEEDFPAIPEYRRPQESVLATDGLAAQYPLGAVQRKTRRSVHTTFATLKRMCSMEGYKPVIILNAEDAAARGIVDGDTVTAFNDRGEHTGIAQVGNRVRKGVVVLENGWQDGFGGSSSTVTSNLYPTLGSVHTCNTTLVEVRKGE